MTPTKLLVGQILIVFAIVILGVWAATEWCAAQLDFQPRLGPPWFGLIGLPGHARIGEAWEERSKGDRPKDYVRIKLDDPSLIIAPLNAALFPSGDGASAQLIWNRRRADA